MYQEIIENTANTANTANTNHATNATNATNASFEDYGAAFRPKHFSPGTQTLYNSTKNNFELSQQEKMNSVVINNISGDPQLRKLQMANLRRMVGFHNDSNSKLYKTVNKLASSFKDHNKSFLERLEKQNEKLTNLKDLLDSTSNECAYLKEQMQSLKGSNHNFDYT
jgi:hypothetical protein